MVFATGKAWITQQAGYCERCINYRDRQDGRGVGCPLDDMHLETTSIDALDEVIPESMTGEEYEFQQCAMFLEVKP